MWQVKAVVMSIVCTAAFLTQDTKPRRTLDERIYEIEKGTKMVGFELEVGQDLPEEARFGTAIDITGDFTEPINTSVAILNAKLLMRDSLPLGSHRAMTISAQLSLVQAKVLTIMTENRAKIRVGLHQKEKH
jgi:hypothetical protein